MKIKEKKIAELRGAILRHNELYYNENQPEISDDAYDILKAELYALEKDISEDLFAEIGTKPSAKFAKIKHNIPMLSLDNAFSLEDLENFAGKIARFINNQADLEYTAELKIDGLSFSAFYENGKLKYVCTRGDGEFGEDVTHNVVMIANFPTCVNIDNFSLKILEIRGEIYISREAFENINKQKSENGEKLFANPRNAASGTLRNLDPQVTKSRNLQYFAYNIAQIDDNLAPKTQQESLILLRKLGFSTNDCTVTGSLADCVKFYENIDKNRYSIGYDIDGLVYKINDFSIQKRLGNTYQSPRWAIAHKFSGTFAVTKVLDVINQIGRMGNITPVAILEPVNVGGVVIKRATLHNFEEIERLGVKAGDIVKITRAGDVIPQVVEVMENLGISPVTRPENCSSCGKKLVQDEELVALRCPNSSGCREQILQKIVHFTSKDALDIAGFGEKQVLRFYELGLVKNYCDIFLLHKHRSDLVNLERFGVQSVDNLLSAIETAKNIDFAKLLYALSIRGVGLGFADNLAKKLGNIDNLIEYFDKLYEFEREILNINGFGDKIATEVRKFFEDLENQALVVQLKNTLNIKEYPVFTGDLRYIGKKILFTGTLEKMNRQEAKNIAKMMGFEVVSGISKNTDYLVSGEKSGSKLTKARELEIAILYEDDWLKMCNFDN